MLNKTLHKLRMKPDDGANATSGSAKDKAADKAAAKAAKADDKAANDAAAADAAKAETEKVGDATTAGIAPEVKDAATLKDAADAAELPAPPAIASTLVAASENVDTGNPFAGDGKPKVTVLKTKVTKGEVYERDGKHVAGDTILVNKDRANDLFAGGHIVADGEPYEIDADTLDAETAKVNTPPR